MNGFTSDDLLFWLGNFAFGGFAALTGFRDGNEGGLTVIGFLGIGLLMMGYNMYQKYAE